VKSSVATLLALPQVQSLSYCVYNVEIAFSLLAFLMFALITLALAAARSLICECLQGSIITSLFLVSIFDLHFLVLFSLLLQRTNPSGRFVDTHNLDTNRLAFLSD